MNCCGKRKSLSIGAVDIGSNTFRLIFVHSYPSDSSTLKIFFRKLWVVRLGEGFDAAGFLIPQAIERGMEALREIHWLVKKHLIDDIRFITTGVVREAINQDIFLETVKRELGIDVRVLEGEEEASLTLEGVCSTSCAFQTPLLVCDIGGGSTEFSLLSEDGKREFFSIPIGAIRLFERFKMAVPLERGIETGLHCFIHKELTALFNRSLKVKTCVATAGTPTTVASIDQKLETYDPVKVHGYIVSLARIKEIYEYLKQLNLSERKAISGLGYGREDIIIPGMAILLCLMERLGLESIVVSEGGLLEGAVVEIYKEKTGISPHIFL